MEVGISYSFNKYKLKRSHIVCLTIPAHTRQLVHDLLALASNLQFRVPQAGNFILTNQPVHMRAHHRIPAHASMWHTPGIQHGVWRVGIPLEDRQRARVSTTHRCVTEPVYAVIYMDHLVPMLIAVTSCTPYQRASRTKVTVCGRPPGQNLGRRHAYKNATYFGK